MTQPPRRMRYSDDLGGMFDRLPGLTNQQRDTIKERVRFLMAEYRRRSTLYSVLFYVLRMTMTVGSLTVPALLSLSVSPEDQGMLKWLTWAISLAVTTANGLTTLFKLDKRFFLLHSVAERLRSEAWQYLALAGHYSGHYGGHRPTHANQYIYFMTRLERIRMKHIDDEFIRQEDITDPNHKKQAENVTGATIQPVQPAKIPTPPDQDTFKTPPPPTYHRRESESTIGSGDDHIIHVENTVSVPVPGRENTAPLPTQLQQGQSLLLQTSELSDLPAKSVGTAVRSGSIQQEPPGSGDA